MIKKEIEKNILDLEYRKQLQVHNNILLFGTVGLLTLTGTFIWYPERWILGLSLTFVIGIFAYFKYKKANESLKNILEKIKKI